VKGQTFFFDLRKKGLLYALAPDGLIDDMGAPGTPAGSSSESGSSGGGGGCFISVAALGWSMK